MKKKIKELSELTKEQKLEVLDDIQKAIIEYSQLYPHSDIHLCLKLGSWIYKNIDYYNIDKPSRLRILLFPELMNTILNYMYSYDTQMNIDIDNNEITAFEDTPSVVKLTKEQNITVNQFRLNVIEEVRNIITSK